MRGIICLVPIALLAGRHPIAAADEGAAGRLFRAIRANDVTALKQEIAKGADINTRGQRASTPLMYAAAYGSVEALKQLLEAGADVNAKNAFGATALMWGISDLEKVRLLIAKGGDVNARSKFGRTPLILAAAHSGSKEIVSLLLEKGADWKVRDEFGVTPLLAASIGNDTAVLRTMLEKGLDVNIMDRGATRGAGDATPLINAVILRNLDAVKLLVARGADVNAVSPKSTVHVKSGAVLLGQFTALMLATAYGPAELVKTLLDAGAKVNVQDDRRMTPLIYAVSSEVQNPAVVRMLLEKGADVNVEMRTGETALDWAMKFADPTVITLLKKAGAEQRGRSARFEPAAIAGRASGAGEMSRAEISKRIEKSLSLLQKSSSTFFRNGGCVSCHHQNVTAMAVGLAQQRGFRVDETMVAEQLAVVKSVWSGMSDLLLQRVDPSVSVLTINYSLAGLAAMNYPPDEMTDAMIANVTAQQQVEGAWRFGGIPRVPIEDSDISRTALSIVNLRIFGPEGRKAEFDQRIARAREWLLKAVPRYTEERDMQLLGLKWANASLHTIRALAEVLIAEQRSDGGWGQNRRLSSDAYATGQALYALSQAAGLPASDEVYRRGVQYLMRTQLYDGSWHVSSRAPKFQPYFESGFPHDYDQWISASASAWATMALILGLDRAPVR